VSPKELLLVKLYSRLNFCSTKNTRFRPHRMHRIDATYCYTCRSLGQTSVNVYQSGVIVTIYSRSRGVKPRATLTLQRRRCNDSGMPPPGPLWENGVAYKPEVQNDSVSQRRQRRTKQQVTRTENSVHGHLWPWHASPLVALQRVMHFRFRG